MRAIQTRYLGPTNFRDSRVRAFFADHPSEGSATVSYDDRLSSGENHLAAARIFAASFGILTADYAVGETPRGRIFVQVRANQVRF